MNTQMMGTLEEADGRWRLRFTRALSHPPEKVWRAITEPEHLQAWFPQRITGDWVVGGTLTFSDADGRGPDFDGQVLAYVPPSLLEFRWGPDLIRLEVEPAAGGSRLTLLDTIDALGKAARDSAGLARVPRQSQRRLGRPAASASRRPMAGGALRLRRVLRSGGGGHRPPAWLRPAGPQQRGRPEIAGHHLPDDLWAAHLFSTAARGSPTRFRARPASCRGHSRSARSSRRGGSLRLRRRARTAAQWPTGGETRRRRARTH